MNKTFHVIEAGLSKTGNEVRTAHRELSSEIAAVSEEVSRMQLEVRELNQYTKIWSGHVVDGLSRVDVDLANNSNGHESLEAAALVSCEIHL